MTPILSTFKTAGRVLVVAAALGGGVLAAAPAMAQSEPSFNFNLNVAPNGQPSIGFGVQGGDQRGGNDHRGGGDQRPPGRDLNACINDNEVIRGLSRQGYSRVQVIDSNRRQADVTARYGRYDYVLDVNKCSGDVDIIDRHRAGRGNGGGFDHNRNGFGLQFNLGN